jgi:hypothetical protein
MLDFLLNPADGDSDISERRRPAQLRAWLERRRDAKVETGRVGPEDFFTLGKEDLVELELMRPPALEPPEAGPAAEAGFDLFGARGGMATPIGEPADTGSGSGEGVDSPPPARIPSARREGRRASTPPRRRRLEAGEEVKEAMIVMDEFTFDDVCRSGDMQALGLLLQAMGPRVT